MRHHVPDLGLYAVDVDAHGGHRVSERRRRLCVCCCRGVHRVCAFGFLPAVTMFVTVIVIVTLVVTAVMFTVPIIRPMKRLGRQTAELRVRRCEAPRYRDVEGPIDIDIDINIRVRRPASALAFATRVPGRGGVVERGLAEGRDQGVGAREEGRELRVRRRPRPRPSRPDPGIPDAQHEEGPRGLGRAVPLRAQRREREGRDAARAHARPQAGEELVLLRGAEHDGAGQAYVQGLRRAEVRGQEGGYGRRG